MDWLCNPNSPRKRSTFRVNQTPLTSADAISGSDIGALSAWCEHLTAIGIPHEGVEANIAGQSVDLFDPDGNNIELVCER